MQHQLHSEAKSQKHGLRRMTTHLSHGPAQWPLHVSNNSYFATICITIIQTAPATAKSITRKLASFAERSSHSKMPDASAKAAADANGNNFSWTVLSALTTRILIGTARKTKSAR